MSQRRVVALLGQGLIPADTPILVLGLTSDSLPVEVEISATPITRGPNSSGCRSTSDITAIPPIEWPTSTTAPVGATSASTR